MAIDADERSFLAKAKLGAIAIAFVDFETVIGSKFGQIIQGLLDPGAIRLAFFDA